LERVGRLELPVEVRPAGADETADGTGWRTRVSLHVDDAGRVGPFAPRSHRVVETPDLPLATPDLARVAADLIRFDTTNFGGGQSRGEREAAEYAGAYLEALGLDIESYK
ncbi:hypothetical protein ACTMSE_15640, partial [Enterococcus faecium]|uniref:hypothetical protein n=1 Tax=Enterococcus faecium TaxID=1352 RepID=UPI003F8A82B9